MPSTLTTILYGFGKLKPSWKLTLGATALTIFPPRRSTAFAISYVVASPMTRPRGLGEACGVSCCANAVADANRISEAAKPNDKRPRLFRNITQILRVFSQRGSWVNY